MEYLLNFFEDLDEMVYISDMETNELVYMNRHLRNALGFENHAQYQGQMCYKVLQGYDSNYGINIYRHIKYFVKLPFRTST